MQFDIIATIEINTVKYPYQLYGNGKRNIDDSNPEKETFVFKFDSNSISQIIFRGGPRVLYVDNKEMYFDYKNNELSGIHFEDSGFIWIVMNYKEFIESCKIAYINQKFAEKMIGTLSSDSQSYLSKKEDEIIDEFDLPSGSIVEENDDYFSE